MKGMVLEKIGEPLVERDLPIPVPNANEVLIKVSTCGVCRTDQHIIDGELPERGLPRIPGHQIIGHIVSENKRWKKNTRVGVSWLAWVCQKCPFCLSGRENLCDHMQNTGWHVDGGYAEYCKAHEDFIFSLPEELSDIEVAPHMCAGTIGLRAFRLAGSCKSLGFFGFGASAHQLLQIAKAKGVRCFVFHRPGDTDGEHFAKQLGADWAGPSDKPAPELLDAAIVFASAGWLVPKALEAVNKGGRVVCAGIHMSDIPSFPYKILWQERTLTSVANLTRQDVSLFFLEAASTKIHATITEYPLHAANQALDDLRFSRLNGAAVLKI